MRPQATKRLIHYLDNHHITYSITRHHRDFTAMQTANDTNTPWWDFAKTVVLVADGKPLLAVLPAPEKVDLETMRTALNAERVQLADERLMANLFPDCELGAESPFGNLYDLPVFISPAWEDDQYITFNAGTHEDAIRMRFEDFARLSNAHIADMTAYV